MNQKINKKIRRNILLNPGPATTTETVKQSLVVPDICPREKEFINLVQSIREDLVMIAKGGKDYTAVMFGGSGTAVMEATMCSMVPGNLVESHLPERALIISNGAYGRRFTDIAQANSIPFTEIAYPWGTEIDLERVKSVMSSDIGSVFITHHETSTGILNDIKSVGEIVKKYDIPYVVDTISSFGGIPFSIKDIKADFIMATSNKCIQGMAGIAFVIAKKDELDKCQFNRRSVYLDLYRQWKYLEEKGQFQFTPPVQVIYALRQAIDEFFEEGKSNRYNRYRNTHKRLIEGMEERGFKRFLSDNVSHSHILETYYEPSGFDFDKVHDKLYGNGITIYPGKLSGENTFRLAVMGAITKSDIDYFLNNLDKAMK